ncbi:MAG: YitT family protein [Streptococcaceae bacterium]|jgi:uncharacterized membrane-anchored protein YitT (DUF2179 family)|nr:YitT family protein [Streptococcaceae bacterium]
MKIETLKQRGFELGRVALGCLIASVGFNSFFLPNNIVAGGMSGLAVAFNHLFGWEPDLFLYITNVPLLIICWAFLGRSIFFNTVFGAWMFPICITLTKGLGVFTHDTLLAVLFGGVIVGVGLGIVFYGNASTGGTGILVQSLAKYTPLSVGGSMLIMDGLVTLVGFSTFPPETVMYSLIGLIIISKMVAWVTTGFNTEKNVMILSEKNEEIKSFILSDVSRGVSTISVHGGHTNNEKEMLMCVISGNEYPKLQRGIQKIDKTAFVIVMPATEVLGRGFSLIKTYESMTKNQLMVK